MSPQHFSTLLALLLALQTCYAPPVNQEKKTENDLDHPPGAEQDSDIGGLEDYMEYHRYLKEVVNTLESDPDFRLKLEKADEKEIKSGKIADELQFVSHHVRTRLDEIKRIELQRLKELVAKKIQLERSDVDSNALDLDDSTHNHVDHKNQLTFEIEDLKKLIAKTTEDLAEADKKRKEDFKKYEIEKEIHKQQKLNSSDDEERKKLEKEYKEMEEKHKKHEKLHQPGHRDHLEEVWQEQDQMQQDFDPKTFFMLHDLDGNGLWDQEEVKALFIKELDKMYQEGAPEDDMRERYEEMERMRESVFGEMDRNRDGFIDYDEFHRQATSNDFKEDHGWKGLDEQTRPYSDEELAQMAQYYQQTQQMAGHRGAPPPPGMILDHQGVPVHPQQGVPVPQGYQYPQGGYQHPQGGYQHPQGGYQQPNQGGYQQQGMPQQVPPGGYQQMPPQAVYQQQGGYQQVPQGQFHAGQVPQMAPQQLGQNQLPNSPQQGQNQPNQQIHSNQINQQQQMPNSQQQQIPNIQQQQNPNSQQQPILNSQQQQQQIPNIQQQQNPNQQHNPNSQQQRANQQPNIQLNQGEQLNSQQQNKIPNGDPKLNMV